MHVLWGSYMDDSLCIKCSAQTPAHSGRTTAQGIGITLNNHNSQYHCYSHRLGLGDANESQSCSLMWEFDDPLHCARPCGLTQEGAGWPTHSEPFSGLHLHYVVGP